MKCFIFVGAMVLCATLDAADSITTPNGVTYTNAVIQRADPDGVVIEYTPQPGSVGIAKLKFANLPDELRKRYNYNPNDAAIFEQNQAAGIARRQEEIAQGEIEKRRRENELAQQRAEQVALEARELAAMNAAQMETGWYDGGYYYDEGDWYGIGRRRFRYNSPGLHPRGGGKFNSQDSSSGVALTGLGTGWGNSGHWGPIPSQASSHASRAPSHSGVPPIDDPGQTVEHLDQVALTLAGVCCRRIVPDGWEGISDTSDVMTGRFLFDVPVHGGTERNNNIKPMAELQF